MDLEPEFLWTCCTVTQVKVLEEELMQMPTRFAGCEGRDGSWDIMSMKYPLVI